VTDGGVSALTGFVGDGVVASFGLPGALPR
jgi:hypothetical protein